MNEMKSPWSDAPTRRAHSSKRRHCGSRDRAFAGPRKGNQPYCPTTAVGGDHFAAPGLMDHVSLHEEVFILTPLRQRMIEDMQVHNLPAHHRQHQREDYRNKTRRR